MQPLMAPDESLQHPLLVHCRLSLVKRVIVCPSAARRRARREVHLRHEHVHFSFNLRVYAMRRAHALATYHCETLVRRNGDLGTGTLWVKQPRSRTGSVVKGRAVPLPARGRVWQTCRARASGRGISCGGAHGPPPPRATAARAGVEESKRTARHVSHRHETSGAWAGGIGGACAHTKIVTIRLAPQIGAPRTPRSSRARSAHRSSAAPSTPPPPSSPRHASVCASKRSPAR